MQAIVDNSILWTILLLLVGGNHLSRLHDEI